VQFTLFIMHFNCLESPEREPPTTCTTLC